MDENVKADLAACQQELARLRVAIDRTADRLAQAPTLAQLDDLRRSLTQVQMRLTQISGATPAAQTAPPAPARPSAGPPPLPVAQPVPPSPAPKSPAAPAPVARSATPSAPSAPAPEPVAEPVEGYSLAELVAATTAATPPPPPAVVAPPAQAAPKPRRPGVSFEQRVGVSWLNKIGIVVMILGGVFFFQFAVQRGWIVPQHRCYIGGLAGLIMLGLGERFLRRSARIIAGGLTGGGIAIWYVSAFAANPMVYHLLSTPQTFALMCAVTAIGVALSLRSGMITTAVLAQIGAYLTPMLLSTGQNAQAVLMTYLLILGLGFLTLALVKRWQWLSVLSFVGTAVLFIGWYAKYYDSGAFAATSAFAWPLFAAFAAYALAASHWRRAHDNLAQALLAAAGAAMMILWGIDAGSGQPMGVLTQLVALDVLLLAASLWRGRPWQLLSALTFVGSVGVFASWHFRYYGSSAFVASSTFAWLLFAAFAGYSLAASQRQRAEEGLAQFLLGAAGAGLMFLWVAVTDTSEPTALFPQLLALDVVLLAVSLWRGRYWQWLALAALGGTFLLLNCWYFVFSDWRQHEQIIAWTWAWAFFTVLTGYAVAADVTGRAARPVAIVVFGSAGLILAGVLSLAGLERVLTPTFGQMLTLNVILLAICLVRRWHSVRGFFLLLTWVYMTSFWRGHLAILTWSIWAWVFTALVLGDVVVRAIWQKSGTREIVDGGLLTVALGLMFWATYERLNLDYHRFMGTYTFIVAAIAIALTIVVLKFGRRIVGHTLLTAALVLLALVAPIQWTKADVATAWGVQAVVTMLIAKRLRGRLLAAQAVIVLALAIGRYLMDLPTDDRLARFALAVGGVNVTWGLVLGAGLAAAAFAVAALLRVGKPLFDDMDVDMVGAVAIAWTGVVLWAYATCQLLPHLAATWWWLALLASFLLLAQRTRALWLTGSSLIMVVAAATKFLFYDTLNMTSLLGPATHVWVAANWQFAASVVLAGGAWAVARLLPGKPGNNAVAIVVEALALLAALLPLWAGSFEVHRFFAADRGFAFADMGQARLEGYSIWWAVYAAGVLIVGFAVRRAALRYFALAVFALTLGKVFLMDMAKVEVGYRIGSFLALGVLMVAGSVLYQRFFHGAGAKLEPVEADAAGREREESSE
jgi:hypothetical protein